MPTIKFSDEEFEHLSLLLSAEIESTISYSKLTRSVILRLKPISKPRIKTSQPLELPATATVNKPAKRRGRPPKNKTVESSVAAAHSVSQPNGVQMVRLEDDFIARTEQASMVDPNARKKKRRRRSNYRRKGVTLEYLGKPMSKNLTNTISMQATNTIAPETMKENNPISQ